MSGWTVAGWVIGAGIGSLFYPLLNWLERRYSEALAFVVALSGLTAAVLYIAWKVGQ